MNKTYLIFKHEFFNTVKRTSWIIMTLVVPVLGLLGIGLFALMQTISTPSEKVTQAIGFVDETGIFNEHTTQGYTKLYKFESKDGVLQSIGRREISEYFVIPADYINSGKIYRFTTEKELGTPPTTAAAIKTFLSENLLKEKVSSQIATLVVSPLNLKVTRITNTGDIAEEQSSIAYLIIAGIFSLLLGISLMFGATALISGLGEEKESRLIEVLFSSVSIRQLLVGKVLALGLAGLLQVLLWLASAPLLINLASSSFGNLIGNMTIPTNFLVLGVVYFVLGYLLFAVLSLGVGAISSNAREGGQLSLFYTLACFIPLWFSSLTIAFPSSPVWTVLSIFPITAPIEVMFRMGVSDVPLWEILTSVGVLFLSIIGGLFLVIKIFRMNMLLIGKRPGFKDIIYGLKAK